MLKAIPSSPAPSSPPLPSSGLTRAELESQITALAGHLNAASHRLLMLIAEFDRREGWGGDGATRSCAHWLSWKCGIEQGAAREKVRVARALEALPLISAAMARGELSYSKVRALTRVATPDTEDDLLMIALHGTAEHVERTVRGYRRALESVELSREAQQVANRGVRYYYDNDGSLVFSARLTAEAGAVLVKALDRAVGELRKEKEAVKPPEGASNSRDAGASDTVASSPESVPAGTEAADAETDADVDADTEATATAAAASTNVSAGTVAAAARTPLPAWHTSGERPTLAQERADALALFADAFLQHGPGSLSGGDRQQIVVHVDAETLRQAAPGRCEIEDGPAIAAATARRLACDGSVVTIVEDGDGQPLDVGRKTRSIPPAIRRALRSRDKCCRFLGCGHTRWLDGHHIRHWADGGHTKLDNLLMLCKFHHRALHEGGFAIQVLDDGALRFVDQAGRTVQAAVPMRGDLGSIVRYHEHHGPCIGPETAVTRWCGEAMDYDIAIGCLVNKRLRNKDKGDSAGTL